MLVSNLFNISSKKIKYGLERTNKLLESCDLLESQFFKIQIIGTNGKGTVAAFLTKALLDSGYKVGTYTSPHLLKANERIRVNGKQILDNDIQKFIFQNKQSIDDIKPSFFEIMTAIAIWFFQKKQINIAILETGLGGRHDSVTACKADTLLFTSISMDHHEILGNTIKKIALEKAQAIKHKKQILISINQERDVKNILISQAKSHQNTIDFLDKKQKTLFRLKHLKGKHQEQNANLAYHCLRQLKKHKTINISNKQAQESINNTKWPGRFQIILEKPLIIYDVAHNKESLDGFLKAFLSFSQTKNNKYKYLMCAFEHNKKIISSLQKYENKFDQIICTETNIRKSMTTKELSKSFKNKRKIILIPDIDNAMKYIKKNATSCDIIAIIGSHFIAPSINRNFKNCFVDNI